MSGVIIGFIFAFTAYIIIEKDQIKQSLKD